MKLKYVTITGADNKTKHDDLIALSEKYPFVEWGILFSPNPTRTGGPRYPTLDWLKELHQKSMLKGINFSAHLCGGYTAEFLTLGETNLLKTHFKSYGDEGKMFGRMQLNFNAKKHMVSDKFFDKLKYFSREEMKQPDFILQCNENNSVLNQKIIAQKIPVHFLYDSSGGLGVEPQEWKEPITGHFTGYAGGLSPDNLKTHLYNMNNVVDTWQIKQHNVTGCEIALRRHVWIDTETGVRTNDELDMKKVEQFLEIAKLYAQ